ncbi:MAG: Trk system potassium transporter TrkA [Alphaproteobacteria bacterium]|nr:Trk system potassium transporter TrkA [Alphaproteobacteria bacterium]
MKIIIAGAGEIGIALAKYLRAEDNDIVLIDNNAEHLGNLSEQLDIQTVVGNASYPDVLERAGADHADVFLAVTGNDEINIVSCSVASSLFHIPQRISRISSPEYTAPKYKEFLKTLSVDVVLSPEIETAQHIIDNLAVSGSVDMTEMGEGLVRFAGLHCRKPSDLIGKTISEIESSVKNLNVKIVALRRRFQLMNLSNVTVKQGDDIYFISDSSHFEQTLKSFGYATIPARYLMIYGGGKVGFQLAKQFENMSGIRDVTLVEKREERARFLAEKLESTLVINGDALDDSLVDELNLKNYKIAIATTNSDENNILLSMLSKRTGIERVCALIHNPLYNNLLSGLGIDTTIDPNAVMVSSILQYLRKGRVKDDYFIQSGIGEILEMEVLKTAKITKSHLGKIKIPAGIVIGGVLRDDLFILPQKDLIIQEKDRVFLFVEKGHVQDAESLFSVGISFF